jgi:hypothetical protein
MVVKLDVGFVESVDDQYLRQPVMGRVFPGGVGADAESVGGVDDDEGEVADAQRAQALADEVGCIRAYRGC